MRTSKRWTNATFTKRVDHEGGAHRGPKAPAGVRECGRCGAVYAKRRWTRGSADRARSIRALGTTVATLCPACRMIVTGQYSGELRLSGAFLASHRAQVERLLQNEASRAADDNPTGRIVTWRRPSPDRLVVTTTTEHLATRLGKALHKAMRGTVRYGFSHENKFAHVTWTRA